MILMFRRGFMPFRSAVLETANHRSSLLDSASSFGCPDLALNLLKYAPKSKLEFAQILN
jgi:hypothetical protein